MTEIVQDDRFTTTTHNAFHLLEEEEEITLNDWQRKAIALFIQNERPVVELIMPRQSGKSSLLKMLMNRVSNNTHMVFPTRHLADRAIRNGISRERTHYYGNLITLREVDVPEIILCDECVPDVFIRNVGAQKILSLYTPYPNIPGRETSSTVGIEEMESTTIEDLGRWRQEWEIVEPIDKEWDDKTN